jgi:hypothetical protein
MRVGRTRIKLARMIEEFYGAGIECKPEWLSVNRGSNDYNDQCRWEGRVSTGESFHSYEPMGDLVKHGKIVIVGSKYNKEVMAG